MPGDLSAFTPTLSRLVDAVFADDIAQAWKTPDQKGGLHRADRRRIKTGVGY